MADRESRLPYNSLGKFYVTEDCIDCDVCRQLAPENFQLNHEEGLTYVHNQPASAEEVEQCEEAMENCPVDAIGDDGE